MGELITLAAMIARGEFHPSPCVEDYRKGMGRREFAAMSGEYADRMRAQVQVLVDADDERASLDRWKREAMEVMRSTSEAREACEPRLGESTAQHIQRLYRELVEARQILHRVTNEGLLLATQNDLMRSDLVRLVQHPPGWRHSERPRWSCVSEALSRGSTHSIDLCKRLGSDPDEISRPLSPGQCSCKFCVQFDACE